MSFIKFTLTIIIHSKINDSFTFIFYLYYFLSLRENSAQKFFLIDHLFHKDIFFYFKWKDNKQSSEAAISYPSKNFCALKKINKKNKKIAEKEIQLVENLILPTLLFTL